MPYMAPGEGLEPSTHWLTASCSNLLSYPGIQKLMVSLIILLTSKSRNNLFLHFFDLISDDSCFLKFSICNSYLEFSTEFIEDKRFFCFGEFFEFFSRTSYLEVGEILLKLLISFYRFDVFDVRERFGRSYVMFLIIGYLNWSSTIGFVKSFDHAFCHWIAIKYDLTMRITGSTTDNLNQGGCGSEKSLFVCIQNSDETYFGKIYSLSQKIYSYQNIYLSTTKFFDNLPTFDSWYFTMKVVCSKSLGDQEIRNFFWWFFGKC